MSFQAMRSHNPPIPSRERQALSHARPAIGRPYLFFRVHAGGIVGENAQTALALARAEQWAADQEIEVVTMPDDEADLSWMSGEERVKDHEVIRVCLVKPCAEHGIDCRHAETLDSVWSVVDVNSAYRRVLAAELALNVMSERGARQ